jgi:serine/threonine-protein kinase
VVDFGISALAGERDTSPDGSLFGTPAYLAPERLDGGAVEPATDVYALGVLLYKSLAGRLPWPIMNTTQMLRAHRLAEPAPLPSSVAAEVPPQVIDLCRRCLAKRPQDRPASGEAARTLAGAVHIIVPLPTDRVVAARSPVRPVEPSIEPQEQTTMSWQLDLQPNDGEPAPGADGAGVVVVADRGEIVVAADADEFVVAPDGGEIAADADEIDADEIMVPADDGRADEEEDDQGEGKLRRRNAIVVMATVALLTAVAWAGVRPASGGSAAGASAGGKPQASVAPAEGQRCRVHYQVHEDWGSGFRAGVAVTNEGSMALRDWQLAFAFASDQRVVGAGAAKWHQSGQNVVAGPSEPDRRLYPGSSAEFDLTGRYVRANPMPAAFDLDGVACKTVVTPAASPTPTPEPGSPKPTPEPGPAKGDQMKPRVKGA